MKGLNIVVLIVTILVSISGTTQVRSEPPGYRCGPCYDCAKCDTRRCCSAWGFCKDIDPATGTCPVGCDTKQCDDPPPRDNIYGWDMKSARANCSSRPANISLVSGMEEGGRNPFCTKQGESSVVTYDQDCGQCLKVIKRKTGAQTIVRLLAGQECNIEHSELGNRIFEELDTDGEGTAQGYLSVDYQIVHCDDQP